MSPSEHNRGATGKIFLLIAIIVTIIQILSILPSVVAPQSSYLQEETIEVKNGENPPDLLVSVPFYVYEEWSWLNAYWLKQNGNIETVEEFNVNKGFKHGDDYWFLKSAMNHPMRTTDMSKAKLFFVPTLLNHFDYSLRGKVKRQLCLNATICEFDLIQHTQQHLSTSEAFSLYPERHVIVRSYFSARAKDWDSRHASGRPSYSSFFMQMVPQMQTVVYESKDFVQRGPPKFGRHLLPSYHVGARCENSSITHNKTLDVAMIARMHPKYDGRQHLCQWLKQKPHIKSYCGKGDRCPALAQSKFGFHVAGDTFGSQRLMDILNSGTVPIFTQLDQYTIQGGWIDWDQLSYYIPVHNDSTAYSEDPVTRFSLTENAVEALFLSRLQHVLEDEEGYRKRHQAVLDHLDFFDIRTLYPFDTFLYLFQAELYPETRHRQSRWSALILPRPLFSNSI